MESAGQGGERPRPGDGELPIHQALGEGGIAESGEGLVLPLEVGVAAAVELLGQPLAAVEGDLDVEGEPGLQASAEEAEVGVAVILVDVQAGPAPQAQAALVPVRGAVVLEAATGLEGLEGADQALVD